MELSNKKKIKIGLYDYESKQFKEYKLDLKDDIFVVLNEKKEIIQKENQSEIIDNCFLFHSNFKIVDNEIYNIYIDNLVAENNIYQNKEIIDDLDNNLWYVIYSNEDKKIDNKYYLIEGDIIKFGNLKFLVNKINFKINNENNGKVSINYKNIININANPFFSHELQTYKKCLMCERTYYIPLCKCDKNIHFSCFQKFYNDPKNNKIKIETNKSQNVTKYYIENFFCSKCNCQYSYEYKIPKIKNLKSIYHTLNDCMNYIILESIGTKDKTVYIITKDNIIIGNNNKENDIIIEDNSIKEKHAQIYFDHINGKIWIRNLSDDFDTSILIRDEVLLNDEKILLKVKNHVFYLKQKD